MEPACERLLDLWDAVEEYFVRYLPKNKKTKELPKSYHKIFGLVTRSTMKAEVAFACSSASIFSRVTELLQKKEPMIHVVYDECEKLVKIIMGCVCKASVCETAEMSEDLFDESNLLLIKEIELSSGITSYLSKASQKEKLLFLRDARNHYVAAGKYLLLKSPLLSKPAIRNLRCLQPHLRSTSNCCEIRNVAMTLPFKVKTDVLQDEWNLMRMEPEPIAEKPPTRIDEYWSQFMRMTGATGDTKYPTLSKVIRAALVIPHGNADVERGFSTSCKVITEDRANLSQRTLNALLTVKSGMAAYKNMVHLLPITQDLLTRARGAHKSYQAYLENERRKKQEEEKKKQEEAERQVQKQLERKRKSVADEESKLKKMRLDETKSRNVGDSLLNDANEKLKAAIKKNDMHSVAVAQAMIDSASNYRQKESEQKKEADQLQAKVNKTKDNLITNFFKKKVTASINKYSLVDLTSI